MSSASLPKSMKALYYEKPREFTVKKVPLPVVRDGDILIKGEEIQMANANWQLQRAESAEQISISMTENSLPKYHIDLSISWQFSSPWSQDTRQSERLQRLAKMSKASNSVIAFALIIPNSVDIVSIVDEGRPCFAKISKLMASRVFSLNKTIDVSERRICWVLCISSRKGVSCEESQRCRCYSPGARFLCSSRTWKDRS